MRVRPNSDDHPAGELEFDKSVVALTLSARFEAVAGALPEKDAFVGERDALTYKAINRQANRVAHDLLAVAGGRDEPVALYLDQGADLAIAILGTLKAGKCYVPLDPENPPERSRRLVDGAACRLVVANAANRDQARDLTDEDGAVRVIEDLSPNLPDDNPGLAVSPRSAAYIIFTSGSTGEPKGVVQNHESVLHSTYLFTKLLGVTHHDRTSQIYTPGVYGAQRDAMLALLNGATLCHFPTRERGTAGLADWLDRQQVTILHTVATVFRRLMMEIPEDKVFDAVRLLKIGGEATAWRDVDLYRKHFCPSCRLFCGFSTSETNLVTDCFVTTDMRRSGLNVPLGRVVEDKEILILDDAGSALPDGEIGEIAVRSRYISTGYVGQPELTARRFRVSTDDPSVRTYLTGDMGVKHADGMVEHRGRRDFQVKIRGFRVDISEIEGTILTFQGVKEAATAIHEFRPGEPRVVAYVVFEDAERPDVAGLRTFLRGRLTGYMMPAQFVVMRSFPQTRSGKVDRQSLIKPKVVQRIDAGSFVLPGTEVEHELLRLWENVLNIGGIGIEDDFFDIGGDSLSGTQLLLALHERFGVNIDSELLVTRANTIARQAIEIGRGGRTEAVVQDVDFVDFEARIRRTNRPALYQVDRASGLRVAKPNVTVGSIATNSLGFRSPEIAKTKPPGTIRLMFLGSSNTFDAAVSGNEATWPHQTWLRLREAYPDLTLDYVNCALPGTNTAQVIKRYRAGLAELGADIVIIRLNDLNRDAALQARSQGVYSGVHHRKSYLARLDRRLLVIEKNLVVASRLVAPDRWPRKVRFDLAAAIGPFLENLETLVALCRQDGASVVLFEGAGLLRVGQSPLKQRLAAAALLYYMPFMTISGLLEAREAYVAAERTVARNTGSLFIDIGDRVPADRTHFADANHFRDAGSLAAATALAQALIVANAVVGVARSRGAPMPRRRAV